MMVSITEIIRNFFIVVTMIAEVLFKKLLIRIAV